MARLNDQFMEVLTNPDGSLKLAQSGYQIGEPTEEVEIELNPWMEPMITVDGALRVTVLKGGIAIKEEDESNARFHDGGLYEKGLHMGFEDEYGDRRYWIADTEGEEVQVSFWDPNANTPNPQDGTPGGQYREWQPVTESDAEVVKTIVSGVIEAGRVAVASQLAA